MSPLLIARPPGRLWLLVCVLSLNALTYVCAQPTVNLQASLVPAVTISGPIGSMQEVQYSTNVGDSNSWQTLSFVRLDVSPKNYFDVAATGPKRFYRTRLSAVADTNLLWIPPGTFLMGSPDTEEGRYTNEGPQTLVTLTHGFFMGRFEVRNSEWLAYMTNTPGDSPSLTNYLQRPVRLVSWDSATNYCGIRTVMESAAGLIPAGWAYRLPSEAEWEYACRAGSANVFAFGNTLRNDDISQDANFDGRFPYPSNLTTINPIASGIVNTTPAGSYAPNAFGLYDVHGNVAEWCLDRFDSAGPDSTAPVGYPGGSVVDPPPAVGTAYFAARGGGYINFSKGFQCRSAIRIVRQNQQNFVGFRVVLAPVNP